jgi:hypothetical protein
MHKGFDGSQSRISRAGIPPAHAPFLPALSPEFEHNGKWVVAGVIYEKDLGPQTAEVVKAMAAYNPDKTWVVSGVPDVEMATESTDDQQ